MRWPEPCIDIGRARFAGLEALLAGDVVLTGDGGGKTPALARSLRGRSSVVRALITWFRLGGGFQRCRCAASSSTAPLERSFSTPTSG